MAKFIKEILPPVLFRELKRLKKEKYGWLGNYNSWEEAKKMTKGYDSPAILNKVETAIQKVVDGEAVFERDSVLFEQPEYNWPLVGALMYAAAKDENRLRLIDFGGSLGSTYFQNRPFFKVLKEVTWMVVEQAHFVHLGQEKFGNASLHFHETTESALKAHNVPALLLSSVLQYIEKPYELLDVLIKFGFETIIVDRTPFNPINQNRICIQRVNPEIYSASYPCHLLSATEFIEFFTKHGLKMLAEFDALDGHSGDYHFKGFIFEK